MARITITKKNCLTTTHPHITALWHPEKNGVLTPDDVRVEAVTDIWWRCDKEYEWKAKSSALAAGLGCPVCHEFGKYILGKNDLQTLCSEIASEWHEEKNEGLLASDVSAQCNRRVWWKCKNEHEWNTSIQGRTRQNSKCPYCTGKRVIKGRNDLATLYPKVILEWDYENNLKNPDEYKPTCPDKVSWICEKGHRWMAKIENRAKRNQKCPYCYGRLAIPGETDIGTLNPEVMHLWDYEKNDAEGIHPENIKSQSDKRIWCKCKKGHSWKVQAKHIVNGRGCPFCVNYKIIEGENDFATLAPTELLEQWNQEKNKNVHPTEIALHYRDSVWWKCKSGHEWRTSPDCRLRNSVVTQCPYCIGQIVSKGETDLKTRFPEILDDFNYERNRKDPEEIHWGTTKKVWWKCHTCGNEWRSSVSSRTKNGHGCPKCHGKVR